MTSVSVKTKTSANIATPRAFVVLATLAGLALTVGAFLVARSSQEQHAEAEFRRRAELHANALRLNLEHNFDALQSLQTLFQYSPAVSRQQFVECARDIAASHPEIQVIEWAPRVPSDRRLAFESSARAEGFSGYEINDRIGNRVPVRAPQRPEYFPVYYVEPLASNRIVMGFDAAAGLAATELRRAIQTTQATASARIRLVQNTNQFATIITLPVYSGQGAGRLPRGVVRGVYRLNQLFESAWKGIAGGGLDTIVVDTRAPVPDQLLYVRGTGLHPTSAAAAAKVMRSKVHYESAAHVAGREWLFISRPEPAWWRSQMAWHPWALLIAGSAFTVLLATYLNSLLRRAHTIERVVSERTARLEEANTRLNNEIAERRRTEEQLRRSEMKLLDAQRIGRIGSWEANIRTGELTWSDEVFRIFGRDKDTFRPTRAVFLSAVHPDDRQRVEAAARQALETGESYHIEHRIIRPDGSERVVLEDAEASRLGDEHSPIAMLVGTVQDITERKRSEDRLTVERNLLATVFESLPDLIYVKDAKARYLRANTAHLRALGAADMYAIIGKMDADFLPAEFAAVSMASDSRVIESGEPILNQESLLVLAGGERRWFLTTKVPFRDASGRVAGIVGVARDITERKRVEEERATMERKFQETQKLESLGVLAGGIAHDFNNLLTGILGNASLARLDLPEQSPVQSYLEQIESSSLRAADLCKQMLAYSGKGRFVIQSVDLSELVQETLHLLQLSVSKKAVLKLELAKTLPAVMADATQMRQIIMNLVINASDAIGDRSGVIVLRTGRMFADRKYLADLAGGDDIPEGDYVVLEVTDNGCGMSPEVKARIFEPFFTTKFTGRGLGLAAVLGIVRGHKGALKVYSEPERGTTFKLLLPATSVGALEKPVTRTPDRAPLSGTILVVDDEDSVRSAVARMVGSLGFQVLTAKDGLQALDVFRVRSDRISAVLLDLTMPHMDGEETFRELRRINANAFILLMSGFNEQDAMARFVGKGLAGFLQKPFTPDQLREKLAALLRPA